MHERPLDIYLYALELENAHFYVGQSFEPDERIAIHMMGKGSASTRLHPVVRELDRRSTGATDWKVAEVAENQWTLDLMMLYGWERVRGGFWCNTCPIQTRKGLLKHGHTHLVRPGEHESVDASRVRKVLRPSIPAVLPWLP